MTTQIYTSTYKDIQAVSIENEKLLLKFLPQHGGKLASFFHKETGREFLVQAVGVNYKVLEYDGDYVNSECSGFDDMFPTIDKSYYMSYPWKGIEMPDHGEVCGLKWDCNISDNHLHMGVNGIRFPYKLEKTISFCEENAFKIEYRLTNVSDFDMDFIWAGHIMLNAEEGAELALPYEKGAEALGVFSKDGNPGGFGETIKWPMTLPKNNRSQRLNMMPQYDPNGNTYKYYFKEKLPEGWFGYQYPSDQLELRVTFPEDKVPYMGVWVNEGSFKDYYNIAPEPCTGIFDKPEMAKAFGKNSVLKAKSEYTWFLKFQINQI